MLAFVALERQLRIKWKWAVVTEVKVLLSVTSEMLPNAC
jgi:hypothetical protein